MKTTLSTATLALLLLAGASGSALAQDRDHPGDRPRGPGAWDRDRGSREVTPPRGGDRGDHGAWAGRPGGPPGDGRGGGWPGRGAGDHWRPGHYPPVFWSHDRFRAGPYRPPYGYYVRAWGFGDILPRGWFSEPYWIGDFLDYGLPYPPPGYEWVRVGPDALMVDSYTGRIAQVIRGIFW